MKDLPHHMKKLNRKVFRSIHREEMQDELYEAVMPAPPQWERTEKQIKKQAKEKIRQEKNKRTPTPLTPEEKNKKMANRVPIFDRNNRAPKATRPSKKKTPRI